MPQFLSFELFFYDNVFMKSWLFLKEAALISHPTKELAQYLMLKNSYSSRSASYLQIINIVLS